MQHFRGPKVLFSQAGSLRPAAVTAGHVQILVYLDTRPGNFVPDTGANLEEKCIPTTKSSGFGGGETVRVETWSLPGRGNCTKNISPGTKNQIM